MGVVRLHNVHWCCRRRLGSDTLSVYRPQHHRQDLLHPRPLSTRPLLNPPSRPLSHAPHRRHPLPPSSWRSPILRRLLGLDCIGPELHGNLRRTVIGLLAHAHSRDMLLAILRLRLLGRGVPVRDTLCGGATTSVLRNASLGVPSIPLPRHRTNGGHSTAKPASRSRTSDVHRRSDAARARLDDLHIHVCHLHPTLDVL